MPIKAIHYPSSDGTGTSVRIDCWLVFGKLATGRAHLLTSALILLATVNWRCRRVRPACC